MARIGIPAICHICGVVTHGEVISQLASDVQEHNALAIKGWAEQLFGELGSVSHLHALFCHHALPAADTQLTLCPLKGTVTVAWGCLSCLTAMS